MFTIISHQQGDYSERTTGSFDAYNVETEEDAADSIVRKIRAGDDGEWIHIVVETLGELRGVGSYCHRYDPNPGAASVYVPEPVFPEGAEYDHVEAAIAASTAKEARIRQLVSAKLAALAAEEKSRAQKEAQQRQAIEARRKEDADRATYLALKAKFETG